MAFLGPGGEGTAGESGGNVGRCFPARGGADVGPEPVGGEGGGDLGGLRAVESAVEFLDGVAALGVEVLQGAGVAGDVGALFGRGVGDRERGDELLVGLVVAAFFWSGNSAKYPIRHGAVQDAKEKPACFLVCHQNAANSNVVEAIFALAVKECVQFLNGLGNAEFCLALKVKIRRSGIAIPSRRSVHRPVVTCTQHLFVLFEPFQAAGMIPC